MSARVRSGRHWWPSRRSAQRQKRSSQREPNRGAPREGSATHHKAVCSTASAVGWCYRIGPNAFRHAFAASNQSHADLSSDWQSQSRAAAAGAHQDREHRQVARRRGRRRASHIRAGGRLKPGAKRRCPACHRLPVSATSKHKHLAPPLMPRSLSQGCSST